MSPARQLDQEGVVHGCVRLAKPGPCGHNQWTQLRAFWRIRREGSHLPGEIVTVVIQEAAIRSHYSRKR